MYNCKTRGCGATRANRLDAVRAQVEGALAQGRGIIVPLALDARSRLVPLAESAIDHARPLAEQAFARVAGAVESELRPRLTDWRDQAVPLVGEASQRGHLALAALKGQVPVAPAPQPKRRHPILKAIGIAALVGLALLVVKTLLGSRDDGWELDEFDDADDADDAVDDTTLPTAPDDPQRFGDGSYIGPNPPEGFTIKGNERSMKYHVPTAIGYERCVTDLWFDSAEAAERAGFTRALR